MTHIVETIEEKLDEVRTASAASGGTALTTTLALISLPLGSRWVGVTGRNLVGAAVVRYLFNPWLTVLRTQDALATPGSDLSRESQDGDATDQNITISTAANNDYIYVGSWAPFRGVQVDIGTTANAAASVLTVNYWSGAWTSIGATDGTASGGATFAVDGNVTWTVPATWVTASLQAIGDIAATADQFRYLFPDKAPYITPLYWTRWQVSAAIGDPTHVRQFRALNRSTSYSEWVDGQAFSMALADVGVMRGLACVEALVDAGSASIIINTAVTSGDTFD